jgi:hypothetical protein
MISIAFEAQPLVMLSQILLKCHTFFVVVDDDVDDNDDVDDDDDDVDDNDDVDDVDAIDAVDSDAYDAVIVTIMIQ